MSEYIIYEEVEEGKIILGGCEVSFDSPEWECKNCGTQFHKK